MSYSQEDILEMTGWSRATLLRRRNAGEFPPPRDSNSKPLTWATDVVDAWMDDEENNPPNAIDAMIMNRYADEFDAETDNCMQTASDQAEEEYVDEIDRQIEEVKDNMTDEAREDALEKALKENPEDDEQKIEEIADELLYAAARKEVMKEYRPKIDARTNTLAKRMALSEMRKWLRRGKKDE